MRYVFMILYRGFGMRLPASGSRGGRYWRVLRRRAAKPLLASMGRDVNIEKGAMFPSGVVHVGDRSGIGIRCHLKGPVTIGSDVMMGPEVVIFTTDHAFSDVGRPMREQGMRAVRAVTIEDDVWIGQRAMILPGVTIGRGSVIAAGAVVVKDVPPFCVVGGNPAKILRTR
ncbi:acyltransferase [Nocardioides sediminis]|uniref:acyltransferase n=1 Tax=Nocardioides sediminis TaxID=433648 RepID=UPI000D3120F2|nr:acyltransferase [Nocardioides sediminis]